MVDEGTEEIYKGVDCGKDWRKPTENIYILPEYKTVKPLETVDLEVQGYHYDCDLGCLSWRILEGFGMIGWDVGRSITYRAPFVETLCEGYAIIGLIFGGRTVAKAYISMSDWAGDLLAYMRFSAAPKYFLFPRAASVVALSPTGFFAEWAEIDISGPPKQLYEIQKEPPNFVDFDWQEQFFVNEHRCDGSRAARYMWAYRNLRWQTDPKTLKRYKFEMSHRVLMNSKVNDKTWFQIPYTFGSDKIFDVRTPRMKEGNCCPAVLVFGD